MNMRNAFQLSTLAVVLAGSANLMAQATTGTLNGQIVDMAGKPIPGARISLESPALFKARVFVADAKGEYHAQLLPVGNYTIRVSAEGKLGKTASDVRVGLGTNQVLSFTLKPVETAQAQVEVVSSSATEAMASDKVSVNYSFGQLLQLPVSLQGFDSITNMSPGVTGNGNAARVRGSDQNQILYSIDGINVKDDTGTSTALYAPLPDSIEDVEVVASALNARNGLVSGGMVNMVTKSGSNKFEGSARFNLSRASMGSDSPETNAANNSNLLREDLTHTTDVVVRGPIIKDRLWFTIGTRFTPSQASTTELGYSAHGLKTDGTTVPWSTLQTLFRPMATYGLNSAVDQVVNGGPGGGYGMSTEDAGTKLSRSVTFRKFEGKLTGMISENHILSATFLTDKTTTSNVMGQKNTDDWEGNLLRGVGDMVSETKAYTLSWNGVLASNWTIEARTTYAAHEDRDIENPNPGVAVAGYFTSTDPTMKIVSDRSGFGWLGDGSGYDFGPLLTHPSVYINPTKKGNITSSLNVHTLQEFFGSHSIDMGAERVATVYNFGRSKSGNRGVFTGGWNLNPTTGKYLYPVFRRGAPGTDPTEILQGTSAEMAAAIAAGWTDWSKVPNGLGTQPPFLHWEAIRGPSAHMERFYDSPGDSKNSTTSLYVNDSWTLDSRWNIMLGARYNKLVMEDQGGNQLDDMTVFEPRLLVKFNPDGRNREIYSFSAAKLASAYSDAVANAFRGNAWEVRTVHLWNGAGLDASQPGFDTAAAASDVLTGTYNGYTYTGQNMHGVRWVDYNTLTDTNNYGPSIYFVDARQTYLAKGLRAPYAVEFSLGYQRNYETGYFKFNATRRDYKDSIVSSIHDYGMASMVHMVSPAPGDATRMWKQSTNWLNSEFTRKYTGIDFSFQKQLSSRWSVMGAYTWGQATGVNDLDYYNYKSLREKLLTPAQQDAAVGHGVLSRDQVAHLFVTYAIPFATGNVSFSLKADAWQTGVIQAQGWTDFRSLPGFASLQLPGTIGGESVVDIDQRTANWATMFPTYYGDMGAYKAGLDYYQIGAKIQWDLPIGVGNVHLFGHVSIDNLFNHWVATNLYGYFTGDQPTQFTNIAPGSAMARFANTYGQTPSSLGAKYSDYNNGFGGRRVGEFSVGLRF